MPPRIDFACGDSGRSPVRSTYRIHDRRGRMRRERHLLTIRSDVHMKAITQHSFGDPDVLQVVEIDPPLPLPTEVLVRVRAIGLNPIEASIRRGSRPML